jgi:hypothetical protein
MRKSLGKSLEAQIIKEKRPNRTSLKYFSWKMLWASLKSNEMLTWLDACKCGQ